MLFWNPQVALRVDEHTYLPLLMPLAPAATLLQRFPDAIETLLAAHHAPAPFVQATAAAAREPVVSRTVSRRTLGVMNELAHLATFHHTAGVLDLVTLAVDLARTRSVRCTRATFRPNRALTALAHTP